MKSRRHTVWNLNKTVPYFTAWNFSSWNRTHGAHSDVMLEVSFLFVSPYTITFSSFPSFVIVLLRPHLSLIAFTWTLAPPVSFNHTSVCICTCKHTRGGWYNESKWYPSSIYHSYSYISHAQVGLDSMRGWERWLDAPSQGPGFGDPVFMFWLYSVS